MVRFFVFVRRVFPPLLIRRKLLGFMILLGLYGWLVYELVQLEHLPHIDGVPSRRS